jgi:hypothetical protein
MAVCEMANLLWRQHMGFLHEQRSIARLPRLVVLLEAWTMVYKLTRWVDLRRSLSTGRILKNMMLFLLQKDRFLHLQATLLKSVRLHAH